jgi:accessory gene regulator protein AgrB
MISLIMCFCTPIFIVLTSILYNGYSAENAPIGLLIASFIFGTPIIFGYAFPVTLLTEYISNKFKYRSFTSLLLLLIFAILFVNVAPLFLNGVTRGSLIFNPFYLLPIMFWLLDEKLRNKRIANHPNPI